MSVTNNTNNGFFNRVGNWFNKNGDTVGKSMQLAGTTAMGVGLMGMMFHEMNKSSGCHHHGGSIWGGGFGGCMSPMTMMMGGGMGYCGMGAYNNMYTNSYNNMMGIQSAYNMGLMFAQNSGRSMFPNYTNMYNGTNNWSNWSNWSNNNNVTDAEYTNNSNEEAGLTDAEKAATDKGKQMDESFNTLSTRSGTAVSGKKFTYAASGASDADRSAALQGHAKSFIANVDKEDGDGDGFVSEDEFVAHETGSGTEAQLRKAFQQFDLNGNGNLDWKEYSALLRTYDNNNDGTITSNEFVDAQSKSATHAGKGDNDVFRTLLVRSYKKEFGSDSI